MADVRLIVLPYLDVSWLLSFKEFVRDICFNRSFSLWGCFVLLNTFHLCDCWLKLIIWALQHSSVSCLQVRNIETGMKQTTHLLSELVFIHSTRWLNIDLSVWNYIIMSGKSLQTKKLFPALVTLAVIVWKAHQPSVSQQLLMRCRGARARSSAQGSWVDLKVRDVDAERQRHRRQRVTLCLLLICPRETKEEMAPVKTTSVVTRFLFAGAFPPSLSTQVEWTGVTGRRANWEL